jgi:hypothetical protein
METLKNLLIKLYLPLFLYGFFVFNIIMYMWNLFAPADFYAYITLISSLSLFVAAPILSLYKVKIAAITAMICLVVTTPMFVEMARGIGFSWDPFLPFLIISLVMYAISITMCFKLITKPQKVIFINGSLKIVLSVLPLLVLALWLIARHFLRFGNF